MKRNLVSLALVGMLVLSPLAGCASQQGAAEAPAAAAEDASSTMAPEAIEPMDTSYIMYLGTNDKDTNEPVFPFDESVEKAKEILVKHFGGYTIQRAEGGWVGDDGTLSQEDTIVIHLSDTTLEAVHAAADELLETFRQNSVLINGQQMSTEFYAGESE